MATLYTHGVVGMGLGVVFAPRRMPWAYWALAALLPTVPDFDSFSSAGYGTIWGHRGFTHSLIFALWLGFLAASLTYRHFKMNLWRLTAIFFAITASHAILDAFTRGGMGIPFFWPIENSRYGSWAWAPIPVADLSFEVPNPSKSRALRREMLWIWLPTALLAGFVLAYRWLRRRKSTLSRAQLRRSEPAGGTP